MKSLTFEASKGKKSVKDIYDHNIQAFSDAADFDWTLEGLNAQCDQGWELYSAIFDGEIVSALFLKEENKALLTKNTSLKLTFQGNGFSHMIKEFYESEAHRRQLKSLVHYCREDDFRGIGLNESHGYTKIRVVEFSGHQLQEWKKDIS